MTILNSLPKTLQYQIRIEHFNELIGLIEGYIEHNPTHREYYESVIIHLEALKEAITEKLDKQLAIEEAMWNTQN